jgi:hypothetical protein
MKTGFCHSRNHTFSHKVIYKSQSCEDTGPYVWRVDYEKFIRTGHKERCSSIAFPKMFYL